MKFVHSVLVDDFLESAEEKALRGHKLIYAIVRKEAVFTSVQPLTSQIPSIILSLCETFNNVPRTCCNLKNSPTLPLPPPHPPYPPPPKKMKILWRSADHIQLSRSSLSFAYVVSPYQRINNLKTVN